MTTSELDELLATLGRQRFVNHEFHVDGNGPNVLGFVRDWGGTADVVIMFNQDDACAYRTAVGPDVDVFAPVLVSWFYAANPVWTLRAVLTGLPPPGHPHSPTDRFAPPPGYALPKESRHEMRIRMRRR